MLFFMFSSYFVTKTPFFNYTFWQWLCTNFGILLLAQLSQKLDSFEQKTIERFMVVSCVMQIAWIGLDYIGFDVYGAFLQIFDSSYKRVGDSGAKWSLFNKKAISGSLGHPTYSGAYIAVLMPLMLRNKNYYLIILASAAILATGSSMALMTGLAGIGFVGASHLPRLPRKILLTSGFFATVLLGAYGHFYGGFFSDSARIENWLHIFNNYDGAISLFGNGAGFLEGIAQPISKGREVFFPAHNELITLFLQYGAFGLAVFAYFLKDKMGKFINGDVYLVAMFLAFAFNALGSFPLHISALALIFIINLSLILKGDNYGGKCIKN